MGRSKAADLLLRQVAGQEGPPSRNPVAGSRPEEEQADRGQQQEQEHLQQAGKEQGHRLRLLAAGTVAAAVDIEQEGTAAWAPAAAVDTAAGRQRPQSAAAAAADQASPRFPNQRRDKCEVE